ncbi:hypothetical protein IFM89_029899 [Coptis chinensis]|uniref:Pentatricopeptide repeat-containing protein n=1 Tax=Coptis chinensis TaxID=261450 RepID=A0A835HFX8_9MAGN|nr:hypothetical protein IFM89_029899 [Coptis chinensis]
MDRGLLRSLDLRLTQIGSLPACNVLLNGLCTEERVLEAFTIFNKMEGDMEMAMDVFRRMFDMQCEPDTYVYNMLLYGCFRCGYVDLGCELGEMTMERGLQLNVKENRFDEADDLFDKMSSSNVAPDHVLYLYLENNYPKGQEFNVLLLVSKSSCLAESWVALKFLPNEVFSVFISALSAAGKTNHALNVFNKMIIYGCEPLLSSYNSLIRTLCQEAHVKEAEFLVDRMCGQGLVPNLATYLPSVAIYDSIIGSLCKEKRLPEGEWIFRRMLEVGAVPDGDLYSTLINDYSINGRAIDACHLFHVMIERGFRPCAHTYTGLINGLMKKNMTEKACKYLEMVLDDGLVLEKLMKDITRNGVVFDLHFYNAVINGYCRAHMLRDAYLYVELMQNDGLNAKHMTYRAHTTWSNWSSYTAINNMSETGCLPDKITQHSYRRSMQEWESS